jgi:hypothetical protein
MTDVAQRSGIRLQQLHPARKMPDFRHAIAPPLSSGRTPSASAGVEFFALR